MPGDTSRDRGKADGGDGGAKDSGDSRDRGDGNDNDSNNPSDAERGGQAGPSRPGQRDFGSRGDSGDVSKAYGGDDDSNAVADNSRSVRAALGLGPESKAVADNAEAAKAELGISREAAEALANDRTEQHMARKGFAAVRDLNGDITGYAPEQAGGYVNGQFNVGTGAVRARTAAELASYGIDIGEVAPQDRLSTFGIHSLPNAQATAAQVGGFFAGPLGYAAGTVAGGLIDQSRLTSDLKGLGYSAEMSSAIAQDEINPRMAIAMAKPTADQVFSAMGPIGAVAGLATKGIFGASQAPRAAVAHHASMREQGISPKRSIGEGGTEAVATAATDEAPVNGSYTSHVAAAEPAIDRGFYDFMHNYGGTQTAAADPLADFIGKYGATYGT